MKKILSSFSILLCAQLCVAQFEISGTVKDEIPLPGATIEIQNSYLITQSDLEGNFKIENLKEGTYVLSISYMGYQTLIDSIELRKNYFREYALEKKAFLADEVIVTSTRAHSNTPTTYTNLEKKDLEKNNLGQDLPYLLNLTPSLVVTSDAGAGVGYTGMRIRGSDATRINVTINGIPVNDAESQGVYWVDLPDVVSSVDNIQIQRGVGTSTNGAGAFGGSVNIQTETLNEKAYGEVSSSYGSFNTMKNTVKLGSGLINNKWVMDARLSKINSDGYVDRAFSDLSSYYLSGAYYGEKTIIKLITFSGKEKTYQAWWGVREDILDTNRTYNYYTYEGETDNYQQDYYQLHFSQQVNDHWVINGALHHTYGRGYYEQYITQDALSNYGINNVIIGMDTITQTDLIRRRWLDNRFYGLTYSANYQNKKKREFSFGGAWNQYDAYHFGEVIWAQYASNSKIYDRYYDEHALKTDFNTYARGNFQWTKKINAFADIQYRTVEYTFTGYDDQLNLNEQTVVHTFLNPKVGVSYKMSANKNWYASFAIGNKEPSRVDYVESSANSRPRSEHLQDFELGYEQKNKNTLLSINYYFMNYKDQLVLTGKINDVGAYTRANIDESYRTGIELQGGIKLSKKLNWNANSTFSINKIKNYTAYVDDYDNSTQVELTYNEATDIAFSPNVIVGSEINYIPHKNWNMSLMSKYVGLQYLDNSSNNDRKLDPYFVNDVRLSYQIKSKLFKEVNVNLLVNNVLNELYESNGYTFSYIWGGEFLTENYYYPQAGTNFLLGLNLKF